MGYTKREFVTAAFEELGLGSYEFTLGADQVLAAAQRLDRMMAQWDGRGIHIGYPITPGTSIDIDEQTSVPAWANECVVTNLSIRLAPTLGRSVMAETKRAAKEAFLTLMKMVTTPPVMSLPDTMPVGAGNKPWVTTENPFIQPADSAILVGDEGELTFE